jgi:acetyl-CoA synthetase
VVFGGFSAESLRDRINDASQNWSLQPMEVIDGQIVPLKRNVDAAIAECPCVENVILLKELEMLLRSMFKKAGSLVAQALWRMRPVL